VQPTQEGELYQQFHDAGPDVKAIFEQIKGGNKWFVHALYPPLETYVRKKVVLVGDAVSQIVWLSILSTDMVCKAHAMLPHLGSGVGQGFEDVLLLCRLLTHPQAKNANLEVSTIFICCPRIDRLTLGCSTSI
jgi:salicylate hydroxylase